MPSLNSIHQSSKCHCVNWMAVWTHIWCYVTPVVAVLIQASLYVDSPPSILCQSFKNHISAVAGWTSWRGTMVATVCLVCYGCPSGFFAHDALIQQINHHFWKWTYTLWGSSKTEKQSSLGFSYLWLKIRFCGVIRGRWKAKGSYV